MTATQPATCDQAATRQAVARLTEAIALLNQVAADMNHRAAEGTGIGTACAITAFTQVAVRNAELALMNAENEAKLAERTETYERLGAVTSNALTPAQQEALGRPCLCYPNCAAEDC